MISISEIIGFENKNVAFGPAGGSRLGESGNKAPERSVFTTGKSSNDLEFGGEISCARHDKPFDSAQQSDTADRHVHFELGRNRYHYLPSNKQLKKRARMIASMKATQAVRDETVYYKNSADITGSSNNYSSEQSQDTALLPSEANVAGESCRVSTRIKQESGRRGCLKNTRNPNFEAEIKRLAALTITEMDNTTEMIYSACSMDKEVVYESAKCLESPSSDANLDRAHTQVGSSQAETGMTNQTCKAGSSTSISSKYECLAHIEFPPTKKKHSVASSAGSSKNAFVRQSGNKRRNSCQQYVHLDCSKPIADSDANSGNLFDPNVKKSSRDSCIPRFVGDNSSLSRYLHSSNSANCSNECREERSNEMLRSNLKRENLEMDKQCDKKPSKTPSRQRLLLMHHPYSSGMRLSFTSAC